MKRLLIIGSRGFVGGWLAERAAASFEVADSAEWGRVEITDPDAVRRLFDRARPDYVALPAAISDIDRCEREPELVEAVNAQAPGTIARECARAGVRLLFTSSGAVFDGMREGYGEGDAVSPVNVYGRSKARAEQLVLAAMPQAVIARLSLVLGRARRAATNAALDRWIESWQAEKPVVAPADEFRNAIDVAAAADYMLELLAAPEARGIYHIGSADALSRLDIVRRVARALGYPAAMVAPAGTPLAGRAARGKHEFLRTGRLAEISRTPVPSCAEVVERCVRAITQTAV